MKALLVAVLVAPLALSAQATRPDVTGTWRVAEGTDTGNGPREVVIRADSSASWGRETVRWRLQGDRGQRIWIAIGGEWEIYDLRVRANDITLSGGGLKKSVTLRKAGPATPRPANVPVPPDPDDG